MKSNDWRHKNVARYTPGNTKILYFFNCLLDGMHTTYADRCGLFFDGNIVACGTPGEFFAGNNFYTTAANRMARRYFPMAVTGEDVVKCLKKGV